MRHGIVLFTCDRGITPAEAAKAAEDRGFDTFYVPEHTHIPVQRAAPHPGTGGAALPDDRYLRTLDPWVSLATAAAVTARIGLGTAVALPAESDPITLAKTIATGGPPVRRPGHGRRRVRLEHRRTRRSWRAGRGAARGAGRVRGGHAGAVDPAGGGLRREVRVVRAVLGVPQAGAGAPAADHRRGWRPADVRVDRQARRRLADHARGAGHRRQGGRAAPGLGRGLPGLARRISGCWSAASRPRPTSPPGPGPGPPNACGACRTARPRRPRRTWTGWRAAWRPGGDAGGERGWLCGTGRAARVGAGGRHPCLRRGGHRLRHRGRVRGAGGGAGRRPGAGTGTGGGARRHHRLAGGHFYLGGGTAVQQATGHQDSAGEMYKYLAAVAKEPEPDKIRPTATARSSTSTGWRRWASSSSGPTTPQKAVIQPGTQGLMFTGNEQVWPFRELATPAPRGHKVPGPRGHPGRQAGHRPAAGRGSRRPASRCGTRPARPTWSPPNRPASVGVAWRSFERDRAGPGGRDGARGRGLRDEPGHGGAVHPAHSAGSCSRSARRYDDGLGIRLGMSVGGEVAHMDQAFITAPFYPPARLITGLIVNRDGRAVRGRGQLPRPDVAVRAGAGGQRRRTSSSTARTWSSRRCRWCRSSTATRPSPGWSTAWACRPVRWAAPLARVQPATRPAARTRISARAPDWLAAQDQAPWAVFDLRPGRALYAGFTLGGLRTTVDGQVQRRDGSVIPGLYAAGACASNIAQDGKGYGSGTQLGEGSFFGRRAGRHAAEVPRRPG